MDVFGVLIGISAISVMGGIALFGLFIAWDEFEDTRLGKYIVDKLTGEDNDQTDKR